MAYLEILDSEIEDGGHLPAKGWHHVEVLTCTRKKSARGADYYNLKLVNPSSRKFLAFDVCIIKGSGTGIGLSRLRTLGAATRNDTGTGWSIDAPERVEGLQAYAYLVHEPYEANGEQRTRCKVSIKEGECGYRAADDPPEDVLDGPPLPTDQLPF